MKILAAADIHGSQYRLNIILENLERFSPDLVVICGDITQFGPGDVAKNFLNQIPTETIAIDGNIDTDDVPNAIDESNANYIHFKKVMKNGYSFVGINSIIPSETMLFLKDTEKQNWIDKNTILVSHVPPYGFQDKIYFGMHKGSKELREIVDRFKPRMVLCGHIHEDPGFTIENDVYIVNCSMGKSGEGALIELNNEINVKMLD